jgi:hypothetical protein
MAELEFIASFGDKSKKVVLSKLLGGYYHIYIDNSYYGMIVYSERRWEVLLQTPIATNFENQFSADDIEILRDIIMEHEVIDDPVDRAYYDNLLLRFCS